MYTHTHTHTRTSAAPGEGKPQLGFILRQPVLLRSICEPFRRRSQLKYAWRGERSGPAFARSSARFDQDPANQHHLLSSHGAAAVGLPPLSSYLVHLTHTRTHTHTRAHTHTQKRAHTHVHTHMHAHKHTPTHTHTHAHIEVLTHTTHAHTHTHTQYFNVPHEHTLL